MIIRNLALLLALASLPASAGDYKAGDRLPNLSIAERGELTLSGDDVGYQPWNYPQQPGKVHVLQYLAATVSASKLNDPFVDRLKTDFPTGSLLSTTILNMDEAIWGTGGFVIGELKSNKKEFPKAVLVADEEGSGLQQWQLEEDSSAVIVTDTAGVVLFFKQGAMTPAEVESTLQLIKQQVAAGSSTASL